jgi:hypothetical protein
MIIKDQGDSVSMPTNSLCITYAIYDIHISIKCPQEKPRILLFLHWAFSSPVTNREVLGPSIVEKFCNIGVLDISYSYILYWYKDISHLKGANSDF